MNLTERARAQGIHPQTAYRWFREGTLPVPAVRVNQRTVLVSPDAPTEPAASSYGLYARVSSHDQKADLDRQVARLTSWATDAGGQVVRVEAARNRALKAVGCAQRDIGPQAVFAETVGGRGQDAGVMTEGGA